MTTPNPIPTSKSQRKNIGFSSASNTSIVNVNASAIANTSPSTNTTTNANASISTSVTKIPTVPAHVQEFSIRVPKSQQKVHHVMRFNATLNVDFAQWRSVKLERENNLKGAKGNEEELPKFGAGSEFNRDQREELRRKKYGINPRKYRADAQPWILKVGGKINKKFKGIREGGVSQNAAFYVFTHAPDGAIEAYPLNEWYNFQPIQRYKALSAEEAEQEFSRRKRVMNYFSLMLRKRLKGDEEEELEPEESKVKTKSSKKGNDLKISEMDEWIDSDDESNSDSDEDEESKKAKKDESDDEDIKKKKQKKHTEKKKTKNLDDEAFEESDDGDEEGREMDYDTESSEDEPDLESKVNGAMKSVAEEDALRKLLTSDEEEEEEFKSEGSDAEKDSTKKDKLKEDLNKDKKKNKKGSDKKDSSSEFCTDSSDSDIDIKDTKKILKPVSNVVAKTSNVSLNSPTTTPIVADQQKRKVSAGTEQTNSENSNNPVNIPAKRAKVSEPQVTTATAAPSFSPTFTAGLYKDEFGITEEAVRRYLMRKPMTATELLTKFKNKKTGVSSERLVETMTQILKKINPIKQTIQGKMYLSIKVK